MQNGLKEAARSTSTAELLTSNGLRELAVTKGNPNAANRWQTAAMMSGQQFFQQLKCQNLIWNLLRMKHL